ncbi:hypothetical protein SAMN05661080_02433 [Modestobacter sp. DSM 44400]|uniref:ANTAR domain-containing protein n=1 Tax=Modestobacter sp. DSM 44400 TaxID=1550230 RepID=UPI00089C2A0C|nr:ANTAR domain-containing protein [Modestobacter sp. DSM 44400]SDY13524.1 hypothetical protein SAMN05661080_02433 [Modestobacter sp. DSM 44400]
MTCGTSLAERFAAALALQDAQDAPPADPALLPVRLSRAAAEVLPADGAGISALTSPDRHVPLGASGPESELAERLQFTVGAGPCLRANHTQQPVFVVEEDMLRRWPAFHDLLVGQTPYRGIVALPLRRGLAGGGAIDLYFEDPAAVAALDVLAAVGVGDLVTAALAEAAVWSSEVGGHGPDWLSSPLATGRARVWEAMGLTSLALDLAATEALAVLRAHAYATGRTVDDLAADVVSGRADPSEVGAGGAG